MSNDIKIHIILADRANYGRLEVLIRRMLGTPNFQIELYLCGTMGLERFGTTESYLAELSLPRIHSHSVELVGDAIDVMPKSTGVNIITLSTLLREDRPDYILLIGDRYETLGAAVTAYLMNIPIIHVQGGELSGALDDNIRHAITKLSHVHFVATEHARSIVLQMGECPESVFNVGCPSVDVIEEATRDQTPVDPNLIGVGAEIKLLKYCVAMLHPDTTEPQNDLPNLDLIVETLSKLDISTVWFWPNIDRGGEAISKRLRVLRESGKLNAVRFVKSMPPRDYYRLLNNSKFAIGNSSSFVRDCGVLGLPVFLVGDRQSGREASFNVTRVASGTNPDLLSGTIRRRIEAGKFQRDTLYGTVGVANRIIEIIQSEPNIGRKQFNIL